MIAKVSSLSTLYGLETFYAHSTRHLKVIERIWQNYGTTTCDVHCIVLCILICCARIVSAGFLREVLNVNVRCMAVTHHSRNFTKTLQTVLSNKRSCRGWVLIKKVKELKRKPNFYSFYRQYSSSFINWFAILLFL